MGGAYLRAADLAEEVQAGLGRFGGRQRGMLTPADLRSRLCEKGWGMVG